MKSIDIHFIQKFHQDIFIREGKYHVELSWYEVFLIVVPSKNKMALVSLRHVKKRLEAQGHVSTYENIFQQSIKKGITKPITVSL